MSEDEILTSLLSRQRLKVKQEITSFAFALKAEEEYNNSGQKQSGSPASYIVVQSTTDFDLAGKEKMVGFDKELKELQHWVLSRIPDQHSSFLFESKLNVTLVIGMAGIGKTTLVKQVYDDPVVINHFDHRLFL